MKRVLITASHHKMADGLKDTLNFVSGGIQETIALSAYVDNRPVEEAVDELMKSFADLSLPFIVELTNILKHRH